jgi:hypothetical protein
LVIRPAGRASATRWGGDFNVSLDKLEDRGEETPAAGLCHQAQERLEFISRLQKFRIARPEDIVPNGAVRRI